MPPVPAWLAELFACVPHQIKVVSLDGVGRNATIDARHAAEASLVSVFIPDADTLDDRSFGTAAEMAYGLLHDTLSHVDNKWPVRFWNFIPSILKPASDELNRYMWFNLGRHSGLRVWLEPNIHSEFGRSLPTATGVGHRGSDLAVHVLAMPTRGISIENPRQRPAYEYSERFGPRPPSFSRSTIVGSVDRRVLLIGGTASVLGEDSLHADSFDLQLDETLENLRALIHAAGGQALSCITSARIYCVRSGDLESARSRLAQQLGRECEIEMVPADLCRPELLVEIEARAELGLDHLGGRLG